MSGVRVKSKCTVAFGARRRYHHDMSTTFSSIDPSTGTTIATYDAHTPAEIEERLARAEAAASTWRRETMASRTRLLERVADLLDARREEYARIVTDEMGKVLGDAR